VGLLHDIVDRSAIELEGEKKEEKEEKKKKKGRDQKQTFIRGQG